MKSSSWDTGAGSLSVCLSVFWVTAPRRLVDVNQGLEVTCFPRYQGDGQVRAVYSSPWWWRKKVTPKPDDLLPNLRARKTAIFILAAVRISDLQGIDLFSDTFSNTNLGVTRVDDLCVIYDFAGTRKETSLCTVPVLFCRGWHKISG
jgi:hypothetical protein